MRWAVSRGQQHALQTGKSIKIGTYNVRNLFLCGEGPPKPQKELRPLGRMVTQVDADLLALQEVGSRATLAAFNDTLAQPYPYLACVNGNSNRSIHLGVLSRLPLALTSHAHLPLPDMDGAALVPAARLQRDVLLAQANLADGRCLALFNVHLKSRADHAESHFSATDIRAAEVRLLVTLLRQYLQQHPEHLLVLTGDFNDVPRSEVLAPLAEVPLIDPQDDMLRRAGRNPSTYWPKRRTRFDRIFVSGHTQVSVLPDSPQIHISHMARTASDHYPVSLVLR